MSGTGHPAPFAHLLSQLSQGAFEDQLNTHLLTIARQVVATGESGSLVIRLRFKPVGDSRTVALIHSLRSASPQLQGRVIEQAKALTPLQLQHNGRLSVQGEA